MLNKLKEPSTRTDDFATDCGMTFIFSVLFPEIEIKIRSSTLCYFQT